MDSCQRIPSPEAGHRIYTLEYTYSSNVHPTRKHFLFLKLDIIRHDVVDKLRLDDIDSKESSGTDNQIVTGEAKDHQSCQEC